MADPKPAGAIDWSKIAGIMQTILAFLATLRQNQPMQAQAHAAHMTESIEHQVKALDCSFQCLKECCEQPQP